MSYALRSEAIELNPLDRALDDDLAGDCLSPTAYLGWKAAIDRLGALLLLAAGWPIILATMLVIRLTSRGPAIYRQTRVGRRGRIFVMYKLRTMRLDAEAASGPVWTQLNDPRITHVGRLVRGLHLDELPQLINVLKGDMSLIGPRPERPEFTKKLAIAIPGYLDRLVVCPGVTGLAQINLPPDTDLDSVRRKLVLDLAYVREGSFWLDVRIFACTCARMFGVKGPRITRLFGLERVVQLPEGEPQLTLTPLLADPESPSLDLVAANLLAKKNGHIHPPQTNGHNGHNGHAGPWSQEVPGPAVRRPR